MKIKITHSFAMSGLQAFRLGEIITADDALCQPIVDCGYAIILEQDAPVEKVAQYATETPKKRGRPATKK